MKQLYRYYIRYYRTYNDLRTVSIEATSRDAALEELRKSDKVCEVECCVRIRYTGARWVFDEERR